LSTTDQTECPLCGAAATKICADQPGYREGTRYAIYDCAACDTHFASPGTVDDLIYDQIYSQVDRVPGYGRYRQYAEAVQGAPDPLAYLSGAEDCYWGVARALADRRGPGSPSVLEIGSGMGYLTYALRGAGYRAFGLELSEVAVKAATARYGAYYRCGDVHRYAEQTGERFDHVVMTEVIEHVEEVNAFIAAALRLVADGGSLIVTTPNKSFFPGDVIWESDPPPVHLWWFSEQSMRVIARNNGCHAKLIDFSEFRPPHPPPIAERTTRLAPTRGSLLHADGRVIEAPPPPRSRVRELAKMAIPAQALQMVREVRSRNWSGHARRPTLCAVLQRTG
jgi:SAM-dependent methyltransferase